MRSSEFEEDKDRLGVSPGKAGTGAGERPRKTDDCRQVRILIEALDDWRAGRASLSKVITLLFKSVIKGTRYLH